MPSHVIGDELGVDVTTALQTNNMPVVDRIAQVWNTTWDLKPGVDLKHFPSSGPYKIEKLLDGGAVVLVANDRWWGTKPVTKRITVWPQEADIQDRVNNKSVDVVDVAAGSSGSLITPDDYQRTDSASAGIEQLIFAPVGPLSQTRAAARSRCARRAISSPATPACRSPTRGCTPPPTTPSARPRAPPRRPRRSPAPIRRPPAASWAVRRCRCGSATGRPTRGWRPSSGHRQGLRTGGRRGVGRDLALRWPQTLKAGQIDALLAGTGGATGGGSTGSSAMDAYALHSGNGNNLSGYRNGQIDGIIGAQAVSADPVELARLLGDGAAVLWADMPTLPLYRQQRTLVTKKKMYAVNSNPTRWGAGWNMDRWVLVR
ncbi:bacterial extracellular solute-binding s, 5 Middle family protein [Mycobacterium xenopi 3993]|nr:bacterial extracellular solute-binding s, 5 Middle family protein [Mycobacterium xenopi 3993]